VDWEGLDEAVGCPGIRVLVPKTAANVAVFAMGRPSPVPLNTWRPVMTRAALTQSSTGTLLASLAFIEVGQQIINEPL